MEMELSAPEDAGKRLPMEFTCGFNEFRSRMELHYDGTRIERIEAGAVLNAVCMKAIQVDGCQLCDPLNVDISWQLLWPRWMDGGGEGKPVGHVCLRADNLRLHAGPRQVLVAQSLIKFLEDNYKVILVVVVVVVVIIVLLVIVLLVLVMLVILIVVVVVVVIVLLVIVVVVIVLLVSSSSSSSSNNSSTSNSIISISNAGNSSSSSSSSNSNSFTSNSSSNIINTNRSNNSSSW